MTYTAQLFANQKVVYPYDDKYMRIIYSPPIQYSHRTPVCKLEQGRTKEACQRCIERDKEAVLNDTQVQQTKSQIHLPMIMCSDNRDRKTKACSKAHFDFNQRIVKRKISYHPSKDAFLTRVHQFNLQGLPAPCDLKEVKNNRARSSDNDSFKRCSKDCYNIQCNRVFRNLIRNHSLSDTEFSNIVAGPFCENHVEFRERLKTEIIAAKRVTNEYLASSLEMSGYSARVVRDLHQNQQEQDEDVTMGVTVCTKSMSSRSISLTNLREYVAFKNKKNNNVKELLILLRKILESSEDFSSLHECLIDFYNRHSSVDMLLEYSDLFYNDTDLTHRGAYAKMNQVIRKVLVKIADNQLEEGDVLQTLIEKLAELNPRLKSIFSTLTQCGRSILLEKLAFTDVSFQKIRSALKSSSTHLRLPPIQQKQSAAEETSEEKFELQRKKMVYRASTSSDTTIMQEIALESKTLAEVAHTSSTVTELSTNVQIVYVKHVEWEPTYWTSEHSPPEVVLLKEFRVKNPKEKTSKHVTFSDAPMQLTERKKLAPFIKWKKCYPEVLHTATPYQPDYDRVVVGIHPFPDQRAKKSEEEKADGREIEKGLRKKNRVHSERLKGMSRNKSSLPEETLNEVEQMFRDQPVLMQKKIDTLIKYAEAGVKNRVDKKATQLTNIDYIAHFKLVDKERVKYYARAFSYYDTHTEGVISEQVLPKAIRGVPILSELPKKYISYIEEALQLSSLTKISFTMFCVICALFEKMSCTGRTTSKAMMENLNIINLERQVAFFRELFYSTGEITGNFISAEELSVELAAGGLSLKQEKEILSHIHIDSSGDISFLDYMAYIPLFLAIHHKIVENALDNTRLKSQEKTKL